jgi:RNA polymerase sigma-70 factor (ECF subfamily)
LVETHFDAIWRMLRRLGLPPPVADDAVQQVYLVLAQKLATLPEGHERSFLYQTASYVAANLRRAFNRGRDRTQDGDVNALADSAPTPEEIVAVSEGRKMLDDVLDALDDDVRQVFVLFELEALPIPEIAELLGIAEGTCASRMRRAREQFQAAVKRLHAKQSFQGRRR